MKRFIFTVSFFYIFFPHFSSTLPLFEKSFLIAQEESLFGDDDLAGIEGSSDEDDDLAGIEGSSDEDDGQLEQDFEAAEGEEPDDNFEEGDFEVVEGEEEEGEEDNEAAEAEVTVDEFEEESVEPIDKADYEIISDRPDYEVISDKELEEEFESEATSEKETGDSDEEEGSSGEDDTLEDLRDETDQVVGDIPADADETGQSIIDEPAEEDEVEPGATGGIEIMDDIPADGDEPAGEDEVESGATEEIEIMGDIPADGDEPAGEDEVESGATEEIEIMGDIPADADEPAEKYELADEESLNLITNIRYLANTDQIIIDCSEPTSYQVRRNRETNQFIIEILQAKLDDNLHWPYVLRDFNTKFGLIKADQKTPDTVRIIIQLKAGADFPQSTLTKDSNQIVVAYGQVLDNQIVSPGNTHMDLKTNNVILPAKTLEDLYFGNIQFSGSPISFHVIDVDVKQVLRFISEESGLNMVIGESVRGTVTLKLEDVPWDQALHTIFKVKSLGYTRDGNVITILPLSEIEARAKKLKEISDRQKSLAPFETKVVSINYGKISEIESKIKDFTTPKSDFTEGGRIIVHPESNTFVVVDTPEVIKKIETLVRYLDKPPKQVMVEAKIVEAAESFSRNLGLKWRLSGALPVTINASGLLNLFRDTSLDFQSNYRDAETDRDAPITLALTGLPVIGNIAASLSLAETEGHAKVVSSPKMVVISGKSATITRNSPIRVIDATTTAGGGTQTTRKTEDIAITLTVTPTVTTTGSVFLTVNVSRADPGGAGGAFKTQRSAQTEVLVKNGQTIVIGGIYEKDERLDNDGYPFFRNIPFLNMLFDSKSVTRSHTELLVFITPKLLDSHE